MEVSFGNLDCTKSLLDVGDCLRQCSPGAHRLWPRGASTPQGPQAPRCVSLVLDTWLGETPDSLARWCWNSQFPQRCSYLWLDAGLSLLEEGVDMSEEHFIWPRC